MRHRLPLILILASLASVLGAQAPRPADRCDPLPGPHAVVTESLVLHDSTRDRDLPLAVVHPGEPGLYPLIVFSHGAGGSGDRVLDLPRFWSGHGYVCLVPTHADSIRLQRERAAAEGRPAPTIRESYAKVWPAREGWRDAWSDRPADVTFLLDALDTLTLQLPALAGRIDANRIGVGGHSMGAWTSQLIGGTRPRHPDRPGLTSFADPRAGAILLLSGQGRGQMGLTEDSWASFTLPLLNVTGSLDRGALGQGPEWRRDTFLLSPPGDKFMMFIHGADHGSFVGPPTVRAPRLGLRRRSAADAEGDAIFTAVQAATLAFWDAFLKDDAGALQWLRDSGPARCPGPRVDFELR